ncbi:MDR family oxidoreductase [uncultured Sphingomonas sp.]|uniref:acrylyl-CoA reductase (NADPH) n=1 Tax=uncultured Sphingomonas sp. TaxID=158754 RepID=UPI0035CA8569
MSDMFRAIRISKTDDGQTVETARVGLDDLMEGDVVVAVAHSTVNYKDGLAITGKGPVVRKWPMIGGIDLAGTVETSDNPAFKPGDQVLLNGYGLSETHYGGYADKARVKGEWLVPLPAAFTTAQAMAIGTAGYTAMLCVLALEDYGITSGGGEVLVTGANGGVGSVAIALLAKLGFTVSASTGRPEEADYLKALGATTIIDRAELSEKGRPLDKERFAAGIDSVGSFTLANLLARTRYGGAVAACGLAQGADLPATVMPFILRGVALLGVDSVQAPMAKRRRAWERLATDLDPAKLDSITRTVGFDGIEQAARDIVDGKIRGRVVVDING